MKSCNVLLHLDFGSGIRAYLCLHVHDSRHYKKYETDQITIWSNRHDWIQEKAKAKNNIRPSHKTYSVVWNQALKMLPLEHSINIYNYLLRIVCTSIKTDLTINTAFPELIYNVDNFS